MLIKGCLALVKTLVALILVLAYTAKLHALPTTVEDADRNITVTLNDSPNLNQVVITLDTNKLVNDLIDCVKQITSTSGLSLKIIRVYLITKEDLKFTGK
jgi:hypothetical protein